MAPNKWSEHWGCVHVQGLVSRPIRHATPVTQKFSRSTSSARVRAWVERAPDECCAAQPNAQETAQPAGTTINAWWEKPLSSLKPPPVLKRVLWPYFGPYCLPQNQDQIKPLANSST